MPFPVPGDPNETVSQAALLVAVRVQADVIAVTVISPLPPEELNEALFGTSENEHCA